MLMYIRNTVANTKRLKIRKILRIFCEWYKYAEQPLISSVEQQIWMLKCPEGDPMIDTARTVDSNFLELIKLDLPRTFPDNPRVSNGVGRRILARILFNVAKRFPDIGYCQVSNFAQCLDHQPECLNNETKTRLFLGDCFTNSGR